MEKIKFTLVNLLALLVAGFIILNENKAAVITSVADGNWSNASTWDLARTPVSTDTIYVSHQVGLNQNITMSGMLTVNVGATLLKTSNNFIITVSAGGTLNNAGAISCKTMDVYGTVNNYNYFLTPYTITVSGNIDIFSGGVINNWGEVFVATLTVHAGGSLYNNKPVGVVNVSNKLDNAGLIDNDWIISVTGNLVNNSGTLTGDGGNYYVDPTFTNNAGASVECTGSPINICRPDSTWPVVNGSGYVNTNCALLCGGPWPTPQPVEIMDFFAEGKEGGIALTWLTASEKNSRYFSIEKLVEGNQFAELGQVSAAGNSFEAREYSFTDYNPQSGRNLYRLKMVDLDGSFTYSEVTELVWDNEMNPLILYPNPSMGSFNIQVNIEADEYAQIMIMDVAGRSLRQFRIEGTRENVRIDDLEAGFYWVQLLTEGRKVTQKLVIE